MAFYGLVTASDLEDGLDYSINLTNSSSVPCTFSFGFQFVSRPLSTFLKFFEREEEKGALSAAISGGCPGPGLESSCLVKFAHDYAGES